MKILNLGSSGQIGAYLSEYLRKKGHTVIDFDKNETPNHDLTVIPNQYLENAIETADFVFFLAFDVGGSRYLKKYQNTFEFINNNTRLMANVFGLLEKYNKRFVFALETVMESYTDFKPEDPLHITSFRGTTIKEVAQTIMGQFNLIDKPVRISPGLAKDSVQMDKRNEADTYITGWWMPKTNIQDGIAAVFNEMKKEYGYE
jgi:nucleoside-diphosphate-sugar epimerase